jgi:hypothetical protein
LPLSCGPPAISATAASLTIRVGNQIATRNDDDWSKSIENSARLALYPLACWLADCWWRLRWESEPSARYLPGSDWRMAHELAAAGHGFLWPNLTFASDSQSVQVVGHPTNPLSEEPVRFLADFAESVPAEVFDPSRSDSVVSVVGLAIRESGNAMRLHFRKRNRAGLRFEAARLLCDELIAPDTDRWLSATDSRTSRQKVQRAFAAQLLCPIEHLDEFLSGDFTQERIEDAAEHFGISPLAISSHLANNLRISRWANTL